MGRQRGGRAERSRALGWQGSGGRRFGLAQGRVLDAIADCGVFVQVSIHRPPPGKLQLSNANKSVFGSGLRSVHL